MKTIYLDHAATTPVDPAVRDAIARAMEEFPGNASSIHAAGRKARVALEESRETIARSLGVKHDELFFTSGGTESDNYAIRGVLEARRAQGKDHIVVSAIEHHAVLETAEKLSHEGASLTIVPVDRSGSVDPANVASAVTDRTALVSVMHANNEVGTLQPIAGIAAICRAHSVVMHTDAVQSYGKVSLDLSAIPADLVSISAHKIYGPKGIGALVIRKGTLVAPQIVGGAQEHNRRAGTENVPLAIGFAQAVKIAMKRREEDAQKITGLRDRLRSFVVERCPGVVINGDGAPLLPNILNISFPWEQYRLDGEALIMGMDLRGIAVTSGSACTSGTLQPSHVLMAMGLDERTARATVRFSLGRATTDEEILAAADALQDVVRTAVRS